METAALQGDFAQTQKEKESGGLDEAPPPHCGYSGFLCAGGRGQVSKGEERGSGGAEGFAVGRAVSAKPAVSPSLSSSHEAGS